MSTNQTIVEIVKFKADGLTELQAQTKTYSGQVKEASTYLKTMAALVNDPRYTRHLKIMNDLGSATERLALKARNASLAARLSDGSAVKQLGAVTKMNAQYDQMQRNIQNIYAKQSLADGSAVARARIAAEQKAYYDEIQQRVANIAATEDLASGVAVKRLRTAQQLSAQADRINRLTRNRAAAESLADGSLVKQMRAAAVLEDQYVGIRRQAELIARYGERLGRFLGRRDVQIAGRVMTGVGVGVSIMAATGLGLAKQGFSGTVEQAKFDLEMKMLSRELAGIMKPVMEVMTKGARFIRRLLEGLGGNGQNIVMGGLLLGGTAASAWAARGGMSMLGMLGTRAATPAMAAAASSGAGSLATQAGGAAAGGAAARTGARGLLRGAVRASPYLPFIATAIGGSTSGDYTRFRQAGKSRLGSFTLSRLASGAEMYESLAPWEDPNAPDSMTKQIAAGRSAWDRKHPQTAADHRAVMLAGGGYQETGAGFEGIQAAIGQVGGDVAKDRDTALRDTLNGLKDTLLKLNETLSRNGSRPLTRQGA